MTHSSERKLYRGQVVWYDFRTNEAAVLIDGRSHTTLVVPTTPLRPGSRVVVCHISATQAVAEIDQSGTSSNVKETLR